MRWDGSWWPLDWPIVFKSTLIFRSKFPCLALGYRPLFLISSRGFTAISGRQAELVSAHEFFKPMSTYDQIFGGEFGPWDILFLKWMAFNGHLITRLDEEMRIEIARQINAAYSAWKISEQQKKLDELQERYDILIQLHHSVLEHLNELANDYLCNRADFVRVFDRQEKLEANVQAISLAMERSYVSSFN